jgi:hypothetical protein
MALWPIFRPAAAGLLAYGSQYARRSRLEIGQIADGGMPPTYETMHSPLRGIKPSQICGLLVLNAC